MSLLKILGNAMSDDAFLDALFGDPLGTVAKYGFQLSIWEKEQLLLITQNADTKQQLKAVRPCPVKPCPWSVPDSGSQGAASGSAERLKVAAKK